MTITPKQVHLEKNALSKRTFISTVNWNLKLKNHLFFQMKSNHALNPSSNNHKVPRKIKYIVGAKIIFSLFFSNITEFPLRSLSLI